MDGIEVGELRARWSLDESDVALVRNKTADYGIDRVDPVGIRGVVEVLRG